MSNVCLVLVFECRNAYFVYKGSPESMGKEKFNAEYEAFVESISEFPAYF
jgi:hypothetical protein